MNTPCKTLEPYENPSLEKSKCMRKKEKREKCLPILILREGGSFASQTLPKDKLGLGRFVTFKTKRI
jgi:hypothetical protein